MSLNYERSKRTNEFEKQCPKCEYYYDRLNWEFPVYGENESLCDDCLLETQYERIDYLEKDIEQLESRLSSVESTIAKILKVKI